MTYTVSSHLGTLYQGDSLEDAKLAVVSCLEVESCFGYTKWETENRQCYELWEHGSYQDDGWWDKPTPQPYRPHMSLNWYCICHQDITKFVEIQETE